MAHRSKINLGSPSMLRTTCIPLDKFRRPRYAPGVLGSVAMRRVLIPGIAVSFLALGCLQDGRSLTSWFADPDIKNQREPSLAAAARVDQVGRQLVAANPFCGV